MKLGKPHPNTFMDGKIESLQGRVYNQLKKQVGKKLYLGIEGLIFDTIYGESVEIYNEVEDYFMYYLVVRK